MSEVERASAVREVSGGPARELHARNLAEAFLATVAAKGDAVGLRDSSRGVVLSWNDLRARVARIAGGLRSLGVRKGDTVALLMGGRPDFIQCDMAVVAVGGVPFSIYETSSPEQIQYVVSDAGARVALVESRFLDRLLAIREQLPDLEHVLVVDSTVGVEGARPLAEVEALDPDFDLESAVDRVEPGDLLTLIYTSGTTGPPKGVELTHANLMCLISGIADAIPFPEEGGDVISWLPAAHMAERGANYYLPVIMGLTVNICPDPRKIVEVLPQVRPTWFFAVPRIWEKLKGGIEAMLNGLPDDERRAAETTLAAALEKVRLEQAGEPVPETLAARVARADEAMFAGIRERLGLDRAVALSVGAAPTPLEVLEFFHAIGLPIGDIWGLSETCGVVTMNQAGRVRLGTAGTTLPGMHVRLAEDGEILVKGPAIMAGYRNMPEQTAEAIDAEGWFATGDVGQIDTDGYLTIVDRKKELIVNAAGKNMSPANIEATIRTASPLIGQAVAIGDGRPYNVALITLDPDAAAARDPADPALLEEIGAAVERANARLSRVEQIKRFELLPAEWPPGGDELTPTAKLKRKPIAEKYAAVIEGLYAG